MEIAKQKSQENTNQQSRNIEQRQDIAELSSAAAFRKSPQEMRIESQFGLEAFHVRSSSDGQALLFKDQPLHDPDGALESFVPFQATHMRYNAGIGRDERRIQDKFGVEFVPSKMDQESITSLLVVGKGREFDRQEIQQRLSKFELN